jgi:hypothetical protein
MFQSVVMRRGSLTVIRDEVLKPKGVDKILDFGCGIGYHSLEFSNSNYLGVEPLKGCV